MALKFHIQLYILFDYVMMLLKISNKINIDAIVYIYAIIKKKMIHK